MKEHKTIPMADDNRLPLFTWPAEQPQLIGAKCTVCSEVVFPQRPQCPRCYTETMAEMLLSTSGKRTVAGLPGFAKPTNGFVDLKE